jgi:hypothetical protein
VRKLRVDYELLQIGQIPVFSRPEKGLLRRWMPTPHAESLPAWKRLLLDDEGLAETPVTMGWRLVAPPHPKNLNFVLELLDLDEPLFVPYLERAVAALPQKRGSLVVVLHAGSVFDVNKYPPFFQFGLLHDLAPKFDMPPPPQIAARCPRAVSV